MDIEYFATFNGDGVATGFYPTDIWAEEDRPEEAVQITEEQYLTLLEHQGEASYVDGEVVVPETQPAE